jgi:hypothetical protein
MFPLWKTAGASRGPPDLTLKLVYPKVLADKLGKGLS